MESTFAENDFEKRMISALALDLPYAERPLKPQGEEAGVLALWGFQDRKPHLLMTRRTETVEKHKGQMAFPGGLREEGESHEQAALRETEEEVGILRSKIRIVGGMPPLSTFTGFSVTPYVGVLTASLEEVELRVNPYEIAEAFWIPFDVLLAPATYRKEMFGIGQVKYPIHVYQVGEHRIWGATGAMIKNMLDRLAALG